MACGTPEAADSLQQGKQCTAQAISESVGAVPWGHGERHSVKALIIRQTVQHREIDRWIGTAPAESVCCHEQRRGSESKALDVPINQHFKHQQWSWALDVIERTRMWIEVAKFSFLCCMVGVSLRNKAKSSDIWRKLKVDVNVKSSQLRWFNPPAHCW